MGGHAVACINDQQGLRVWDPNGGITIFNREGDATKSLSNFLFGWFVRVLHCDFNKVRMFSNVPHKLPAATLKRTGKISDKQQETKLNHQKNSKTKRSTKSKTKQQKARK